MTGNYQYFEDTIKRHFIDSADIEVQVTDFNSRKIKSGSELFALKLAVSLLDLTSLDPNDTPERIRLLSENAKNPLDAVMDANPVAAVCIFPHLIGVAKETLRGSTVKIASVTSSFPSGDVSTRVKLEETRYAISEGADEIDIVLPYGHFLNGDLKYVFDEIVSIKKLCGAVHLKVILETGMLETYENIHFASMLAMYAGADFIKTSTGKVQPAATLGSTFVMMTAIRDFYLSEGIRVGLKPAGGISTANVALQYLIMANLVLGEKWLTPDLFRFGSSSLLNDLKKEIEKQLPGNYQTADRFAVE